MFLANTPLLVRTLSLRARRESQVSIFNFRLPNKDSEVDFADDEFSNHGDSDSRGGSLALPWSRRRTSAQSTCSHSSQFFFPSLNINGKLFVAMDQNGLSGPGPLSPLSPLPLPTCTMEKVKEESVSHSVLLIKPAEFWKLETAWLICNKAPVRRWDL